ncbi:MAG: hypothetical protein JST04_00455 [Bdellovibrionales bacterium]|nr:hypothetical protein [Bdellovibrionales bacterium]
MKTSLFILFAVFSASTAFADPDPSTPFRPRFEAMQEACLKRDYAAAGHTVESPKTNAWNYEMREDERYVGQVAMKIPEESSLWARAAERKLRNRSFQDDRDYAELLSTLKAFAARENLDAWGRACLAKCAAAHMVTYVDSKEAGSLYRSSEIVEAGIGVCRQFSYVGADLGNALGVSTELMSENDPGHETGHAFLRINIDGVGYYSEPQLDSCVFYSLH